MNKNQICEAMYALPGKIVVKRRKPQTVPAVLFLVGTAMLAANHLYGTAWSADLRSATVFIGGAAALSGFILAAARLSGSGGIPYHREASCYLRYDELNFAPAQRAEVERCVAEGDIARLLSLPQTAIPSLSVAFYHTPDNRFAAMQAFEYAELEYRPLTGPKVVGER